MRDSEAKEEEATRDFFLFPRYRALHYRAVIFRKGKDKMNTSNMSGSLLPFALGVGVGAAVALLLAPRSGEEFREDISGKVTDAKERVDEAVQAGEAAFNEANKE